MTTSHTPSTARQAARQLRRDFAAGELRLLMGAVLLAVAALTAVAFFADRMRAGLWRDAAQLLGGDAVLASDRPLPESFVQAARSRGLTIGRGAEFPSMARAPGQGDAGAADAGGAARLASVKVVESTYPLRGAITVRDAESAVPHEAAGGPREGTVWIDPSLAAALRVRVGDVLALGDSRLRIGALIGIEPDRGAGFVNLAPRLMLSFADLPATGLVQPASRVAWRLAVAAPPGRTGGVDAYLAWANAEIKRTGLRGVRIETLQSGRPEMRQTLDRAERFLGLVALMTALLSAVAVGVAARGFAQARLDDCAMLRVLGQTQRTIARVYALEFTALGLIASLLGVAAGFVLQQGFVALLAGFLPAGLPLPGPRPALLGVGVGLVLLLGFGLPPVLQLARVPPLRVLRRDLGAPKAASVGVLLGGLIGFCGLLVAASHDLKLGLYSVGGFALAALLFAGIGGLAVMALRRAVPEARAPRWLILATRSIAARPAFAMLQVASMALGLMALWLLVLLRTDLIDSWRAATPVDAPNRFVINIQPDQAADFRAALARAGVADYDWSPMVRGRLVSINGAPVGPRFAADEAAHRLVEREFNLSYGTALPRRNQVVAGRWSPGEADGASVEQGLANTLGLKLGDRLQFDIAGELRDSRVTSLRKLDWGSMRVNFFVMFPRPLSADLPVSYISAFKAPTPAAAFDDALATRFPNISSIDVSATIAQLQQVLDQVVHAVELLFVFALVAGLIVLLATVGATRESRAREFAVMRALGASARLLGQVQRAELAGVGALAGLLASGAAVGLGWVLAAEVFDFRWNPPLWVPLAGAASGALLALLAGAWSLREVLRRPVTQTLREAQAA